MDTNHFKEILLAEEKRLTEALAAEQSEATEEGNLAVETRDEVAEKFEDSDEREATHQTLENHLTEVRNALAKIGTGTYGKCEVCQEPIEIDRLEASPTAKTCKKHLSDLNGH